MTLLLKKEISDNRSWPFFVSALSVLMFFSFSSGLPTPSLNYPENNATGINIIRTLSWYSVQGALSYKVQVDDDQDFSADWLMQGTNLTDIDWSPSEDGKEFPSGTILYWRVIAYAVYPNDESKDKSASVIRTFTTMSPPAVPVLNYPGNGAMNIPREINLTFSYPTGTSKWKYMISTSETFELSREVEVQNYSQQFIGLAPDTRYYCKVAAGNAGGWSAYSPVSNFRTQSHMAGYDWNMAIRYAKKYSSARDQVPPHDGDNYNPIYFSYHTIGDVGDPLPPHWGYCSYYYDEPTDCGGDCTNFIAQCLKAGGLTLSSPAGGYINDQGCIVGVEVLHDWIKDVYNDGWSTNHVTLQNGALPSGFKIEVGDVIQFGESNTIPDMQAFHHSAIVTKVTDPNTTTGIYVAAHNKDATEKQLYDYYPVGFNRAYFHRMRHEPIGINDIVDITSGPDVISNYPGGVVTYRADFYDMDGEPTTCTNWDWRIVFYHETGSFTAVEALGVFGYNNSIWSPNLSALPPGYNWIRDVNERILGSVTVIGYDSDEYPHIESKQIFCAAPARPISPLLASPTNGLSEVPLNPILQWQTVSSATSYRLQVSRDPEFWTADVYVSVVGTSYTVANLLPGIAYYWRAAAMNDWGTSNFSSIRTFQTTNPPVLSFLASTVKGTAPLAVSFFPQNTGGTATSWDWDFGDGSIHSNEEAPTHIYRQKGVYTVSVTATNSMGATGASTNADYITIYPNITPILNLLLLD